MPRSKEAAATKEASKSSAAKKAEKAEQDKGAGKRGGDAPAPAPRKKRKAKDEDEEEEGKASRKGESKKKRTKTARDAEEKDDDETDGEMLEDLEAEPAGEEEKDTDGVEAEDDPLAVEKFNLSEATRKRLKEKGIEALFPIQAQTLDLSLEGHDVVGRAKTGCGKTLAFVLPVVETLAKQRNDGRGRPPRVLVLAPTRELAKQVHADFEYIGAAHGMATVSVYGGAPYAPQETALRRGVDVVVGTPGRIKDHLDRGTLKLGSLQFRVLDEADEMLNMGFVDDVETILKQGPDDASTLQTLLFSATLPEWVQTVADRFLKKGYKTVDLVGDDTMKASTSVTHLALPMQWHERATLIADLVRCRAPGGARTIVFCDTKRDCAEIAEKLQAEVDGGAKALHGDVTQANREVALGQFRDGKFQVLVATDVAARGLDITGVELVIQCEPPKDAETYIHRSGRTGRAGAKGTCVTLCTQRSDWIVKQIERKAGIRFQRVGAPQPREMAETAARAAVAAVRAVEPEAAALFRSYVADVLEGLNESDDGRDPLDAIAACLAKIAGYSEVRRRSLLTAHTGSCTLILSVPADSGVTIRTPTYVWNYLRKVLPENKLTDVRRLQLTADAKGAVFDVPGALAKDFVAASQADKAHGGGTPVDVAIATELPELLARPEETAAGDGRSYSNGGGRGYGSSSWGGGGGGKGAGRSPGGKGGYGGWGGGKGKGGGRNGFGGKGAGKGGGKGWGGKGSGKGG